MIPTSLALATCHVNGSPAQNTPQSFLFSRFNISQRPRSQFEAEKNLPTTPNSLSHDCFVFVCFENRLVLVDQSEVVCVKGDFKSLLSVL